MSHPIARLSRRLTLLACSLPVVSGCQTDSTPPPDTPWSPPDAEEVLPTTSSTDLHTPPAPVDATREDLSPAALRRLTSGQIASTLQAVYGEEVPVPSDLAQTEPIDGSNEIASAHETVQYIHLRQYERTGLAVASWLMSDPARMEQVGLCVPQTAQDVCLRSFMRQHAERLWRRPVENHEVSAWIALVEELELDLGTLSAALEYAIAALIVSPHFIYRAEVGEVADPDAPDVITYTSLELASKLAYVLWDAPPDEELYQAGVQGLLTDPTQFDAQVDRLMASPRFDAALVRFYLSRLELDRLDTLQKDAELFPMWTPEVVDAASLEAQRSIEQIISDNVDYRTLFTNNTVFADAHLAPLYGLQPSDVSADRQVDVDPLQLPPGSVRQGMLGSVAWLARHSGTLDPSPMGRGYAIRQTILCEEFHIPENFDDIVAENSENISGEEDRLLEEGFTVARAESQARLNNATCNSCHQFMDPLGLGLENLDAVGMFRDTEHGIPIDPSGDYDGVAFEFPTGLGELLAQDPGMHACAIESLRHHLVGDDDAGISLAELDRLGTQFEQHEYSVRRLARDIVRSPSFKQMSRTSDLSDGPVGAP